MLSSGPDFHKKSFHIKHDDKFFSRFLSKESSMTNPSFRVYYGDVSGAVPFTWESRPGTPKYAFSDSTLPPLTPPPSYYSNTTKKPAKKQPRSKLLRNLLMRMNLKKAHLTASLSSSSSLSSESWSSSSYSSFSGALTYSNFQGRRRFSSWGSSFDDGGDDPQEMPGASLKKSRFCFSVRRDRSSSSSGSRNQGGNSAMSMKKNLLSIIGCGSG